MGFAENHMRCAYSIPQLTQLTQFIFIWNQIQYTYSYPCSIHSILSSTCIWCGQSPWKKDVAALDVLYVNLMTRCADVDWMQLAIDEVFIAHWRSVVTGARLDVLYILHATNGPHCIKLCLPWRKLLFTLGRKITHRAVPCPVGTILWTVYQRAIVATSNFLLNWKCGK
jgi:hypothetical protein